MGFVEAHRDLGDAIVARLARRRRFHFDLLQLAGVEHAVEFPLQQLPWLAVEDLEDLPAHGVLARHALRPALALAVPRPDHVGAVDDVQADGEGVDDARREIALGLDLAGAQRDFGGEVLRQLGRGDHRCQDLCHHHDDVVRHAGETPGRDDHLENAEPLILVHQRQPQQRALGGPLLVRPGTEPIGGRWGKPREQGLVAGERERGVRRAVRRAEPQPATRQPEAAPHRRDRALQRLFRRESVGEDRRHVGDDLQSWMIGVQRRRGHLAANLGMRPPPRQRRIEAQAEQGAHVRLVTDERRRAHHQRELAAPGIPEPQPRQHGEGDPLRADAER